MATKARDAFRTISEVADWLDVPAHVLRFWESKFSQIKPVKRAGGRRYYRPDDMLLIGGIKKLLHDDGMTIRGVQKMLKEEGVKTVAALSQSLDGVDEAASSRTKRRKQDVEAEAETDAPPTDTAQEHDGVEDAETVAAWTADAEAETAPEPHERGAMHIDPTAAQAADTVDAPDAPGQEEPPAEPEPDETDNVVAMPSRSEPETDATPEDASQETPQTALDFGDTPDAETADADASPAPEPEAEPDTASEPEPAPIVHEAEPSEPEGPAVAADTREVQLDPDREKTLPPTELPAEMDAAPPPAAAAPADRSDALAAARSLKRVLRGSDSTTLSADPALAAQAARLSALRDRIAAQVAGD